MVDSVIFGDPGTAQPMGLGLVMQRPNFVDGTEQSWETLREWLRDLRARIWVSPRTWRATQSGDTTLILAHRAEGDWLILLWKGPQTWAGGLTDEDLDTLITEGAAAPEVAEALAKKEGQPQAFTFMPCPFCRRNTAQGRVKEIEGQQAAWVECGTCGAIGPPHSSPEAALEAWNFAYKPKLTLLGMSATVEPGHEPQEGEARVQPAKGLDYA
jgi:hypothetical protein